VSHDGSEWQARWWTRGQPPSNRRWGPWKRLGRCTEEAASRGTCTTSWNTSTVYRAGDVVSHDGSEWQARWWTRGQPPANRPSGPWDQLGRCTP
jgi:chitodextrinase